MKRINDKIEDLLTFLADLKEIMPESLEDYESNKEKKAACERYFERIMEAVTDVAFYVIKIKKLRIPEDDGDAFEVLREHKIIDDSLSKKLRNAKGMRNILAHEYGNIDDEIVFDSITRHVESDVKEFIKTIKKSMKG